ncbi:MAG: MEDS domain-containing protein [Pseudomonadota bacterium]
MQTNDSWQSLLAQPEAGNHIVQICQNEIFLIETVTHFARTGLNNDEAVIVITTPARRKAIISSLELGGDRILDYKNQGQIRFFDAEILLSSFMVEGMPEWEPFFKNVGPILQVMQANYKKIRAYGDMVNILWQNKQHDAAIQLEKFWNDLSDQEEFSLLCAYSIDNLNPDSYDGSLARICQCHSHLIPTENYDLLEAAVQEATYNVLGPTLTQALIKLAAARQTNTQMPSAQATLLFLSEKMPLMAKKILAHTQTYYAANAN